MKNTNLKSGITFSVLIVAIVIMLIVISTAAVVGAGSISSANFEKYQSELRWVADDVNEYYLENKTLPVTDEFVSFDSLNSELKAKIENNSDAYSNLYVIDVTKLNDANIENGKGSVSDKDVYIVSDKTQNVYYLKGYKYKDTIYYGL